MRRLWSLVILAAVAVPAAAQETPRERDTSRVHERGFQYFYGPRGVGVESFQRGRLGILVDLTADPARDSIGAKVAGLTPDSPAAKGGVQVGDLVVRLNGTTLVRRAGRNENGDEEAPSRPGMRLIELASRLDPGDTVHLDLKRGAQSVSATVVARESGMDEATRSFGMVLPRSGELFPSRVPMPRGQTFVLSGGPFADIELVKVNPGLADYFGTSEGLLVVNVGDDSTFGLKSGDVILSIGGRKPLNPAHALRILGTYEPDETVSFDIMRMKHRATVSGKMPARHRTGWSITPNSFEFDMPMPGIQGLQELRDLPETMLRLPSVFLRSKTSTRTVET